MTLAITLATDGPPDLEELESAIPRPARPLFIGRKTCLPAAPLLLGRFNARNLLVALKRFPLHERADAESFSACWPAEIENSESARLVTRYDRRDWLNQIHAGARRQWEGLVQWRAS